MKIRQRVPILNAEIYKPGMEDGFVEMWYNKETYGVCSSTQGEYFDTPINLPYILTSIGKEIVNEGDVIIINPRSMFGRRDVIHKTQFERNYEIVDD